MSDSQPSLDDALSEEHRFFVGSFHGTFASQDQAVAAARLGPDSVALGEFQLEGARLLAFKSAPGTTDTEGLELLILQPTGSGSFHLWLSATDLARTTRAQADDDVENYMEIGGGHFRVFELKPV
jgi:hypothetical protein